MIYTITLNPSLDYVVRVNDFQVGGMNRCSEEQIYVGGKGINVSLILHQLGIENEALGFVAGFTGGEIIRLLDKAQVKHNFITLKEGMSRINMKLKSGEETEINGRGPHLEVKDLIELEQQLECMKEGDFLILAGSIPSTLPSDTYEQLVKKFSSRGIACIVDATKDLLLNVLPYGPFLIKPNHHELGELFDMEPKTHEEVIPYAKKLQEKGARNVLVSMAGLGAVLVTEDGTVLTHEGIDGKVKNSVGAGDSMVAGFIAGYKVSGDFKEALKMGMAAGSATAFEEDLATGEQIKSLFHKL